DPDAGADDRAAAFDRIGLRDHLDDPLRDLAELAAIVSVRNDHLELVTAQAPDLRRRRHDALQTLRDLLEQVVSRGMAERVVDLLEAIEVEHQQGAAALRHAEGRQAGGQARAPPVPGWPSRQR